MTKLVPVTVMVLLTYPASGVALVMLGGERTLKPALMAWAPAPPPLNVTFTSEDAAGLDAPNTTTTLVADDIEHEAAAVPPTSAEQVPPCAGVMKLAPPTVIRLDWYPASGVNVDAVGELSTVKTLLADVPTLCGLTAPADTIVTSTVEGPTLAPASIVSFAVVASTSVHCAEVPPTTARHDAAAS